MLLWLVAPISTPLVFCRFSLSMSCQAPAFSGPIDIVTLRALTPQDPSRLVDLCRQCIVFEDMESLTSCLHAIANDEAVRPVPMGGLLKRSSLP